LAASLAAGPLEVPADELPLLEELLPEELLPDGLLVELPPLEELLLELPLELPPGKDATVDALPPLELVALAPAAELEPEPPHAASAPSSAHEQQRSSIVLSISIFLSNQRALKYYSWQRAHYGKAVSNSRCVAIS
jgi:hypothetical protein